MKFERIWKTKTAVLKFKNQFLKIVNKTFCPPDDGSWNRDGRRCGRHGSLCLCALTADGTWRYAGLTIRLFCHFYCKCLKLPSSIYMHRHQCVSVRVHSSSSPHCLLILVVLRTFLIVLITSGGGGQKDQPDRELSSTDHDAGTSFSLQ